MDKDKLIGTRLDGRYELTELVGEGGMADVYRAVDVLDNRVVAVKILEQIFRKRRVPAPVPGRIQGDRHDVRPNIVKIYDMGFSDKMQYIVMEYIDGITLKDYIDQRTRAQLEGCRTLCHPDPPCAPARPQPWHCSPGHQAPEHHAADRRHDQGHGLRYRQVRPGREPDCHRPGNRYGALYQPGAGPWRCDRCQERPLFRRCHVL